MKVRDLKIALLKGMVLTIPFGSWSPFPIPYTSLTFLIMYAYLGASFLTFRESFSPKLFRHYALPFLMIWIIMLTTTLTYYYENAEGASSVLRQFVFFSAFFSFAIRDNSVMASRGENLYGYFLISVLVVVAVFFGGFSRDVSLDGRQTLSGVNPNLVAMYSASGFLVLMDSLLNAKGVVSTKLVRQISVVGMIGFGIIIALTGSRGGILILAATLFVYFSTWRRMSPRKLSIVIPIGIMAFYSAWLIASSDVMSERIGGLDEDIRLTVLWPAGLEIVKEYPVFGAGLGHVEAVLRRYTGTYYALHNEYLKIAASAGLVGLFFFVLVFKRLLDNALEWRRFSDSGLQLALWTLVALFLAKGGGALGQPFVWVIFLLLSGSPISRSTIPSYLKTSPWFRGASRARKQQ